MRLQRNKNKINNKRAKHARNIHLCVYNAHDIARCGL